jgi:hypothetical protein
LYDSECHCLQNGHWKSLAMMTQVFAAVSPAILPWSAAASNGSGADDADLAAVAVAPSVAREFEFAGLQAMKISSAVTAAPKLIEAFGIG